MHQPLAAEYETGQRRLTRTSTCDMLPMTLFCASKTGSDDTPSLFMSSRAAARGLSPLISGQLRVFSEPALYLLDGENRLGPKIQVFDQLWVQLVHAWEARSVLPEELHQSQLGKYAFDVRCAFFCDQHSMYTASEDFHGLGQIRCLIESNQRLLPATHLFYVFERYGLSFSSFLCKLIERGDVAFLGVREADYEEEVRVQVAIVEGPGRMPCVRVFAQEDNIGGAMFD